MENQSAPNLSLLQTQNLTVGFQEDSRRQILLQDLNLQLLAGQLVCFMGVNGVGKSTLIRTLAGIQKPLAGSVQYYVGKDKDRGDDESRTHNKRHHATEIAVVLTDRISASHLTVYELITYGRYPYVNWRINVAPADLAIIDSAIAQVNIGHLIGKKLYQLSDGQLQMVLIARALAQDTGIILLDEPTAHLDLNNRVEIMNLLRELVRKTNKAILVATHELDLALQTADVVWLANQNHEILTGLPEDLVLNGCFDEVFQFKGFDLKTGKLQHQPYQNTAIELIGEGHEFRWTKNALERNGFSIQENTATKVSIHNREGKTEWQLMKEGRSNLFFSLASLIDALS